MKMIVGLGNPGTRYAPTRHNIGFMTLEALARHHNLKIAKKQCRSLLGQGYIGSVKVLLVKPQTYMNKSGEAVWEILNYYQEGIEDLLIIHDDLDLLWGKLRFKRGGGSGGHNGLKSITKMLNSSEYCRLKVGIGRPPAYLSPEVYVLSPFLEEEKEVLPQVIQGAVQGLETWCGEGIEAAMNKCNSFQLE